MMGKMNARLSAAASNGEASMRHHFIASILLIFAVATQAAADEYPSRRAGHWELTLTAEDNSVTPQVLQLCVDAESDQALHTFGGLMIAGTTCTQTLRKEAAAIHVDTVCRQGPTSTAYLQTIFTGDLDTNYTVRATTRVENESPADKAEPPRTVLIAAKWLGPCQGDQRPGDIVMPGGKRVNVIDFKRAMEKLNELMKKKKFGNP